MIFTQFGLLRYLVPLSFVSSEYSRVHFCVKASMFQRLTYICNTVIFL